MKMTDVQPGMKLRDIYNDDIVTVTELTENGFKYSLSSEKSLIPRLGMVMARDGHEHFGLDGEASFELANEEWISPLGKALDVTR